MTDYIYRLGEFSGSDLLELRRIDFYKERKFLRSDSLYIDDTVFFHFLEGVFCMVVDTFDMYEDTVITKDQWRQIMALDISTIIESEDLEMVREVLRDIDAWVEDTIKENDAFIVMGV